VKFIIPTGLTIGLHSIPIDNYLVKTTEKNGFKNTDLKLQIEHNKHNNQTAAYYMLLN
jgi:hypothetical protein